jgi:thioester reductase-like protein
MRLAIEASASATSASASSPALTLHHISTLSVAANAPTEGAWDASGLALQSSGHTDGYTRSKWLSELIVRQLCPKFGVGLCIYR